MKRTHPELVSPGFLLILGLTLLTLFLTYADPRLHDLLMAPSSSKDVVRHLGAGPLTTEQAHAIGQMLEGSDEYAAALARCVRMLSNLIKVLCFIMVVVAIYDLWVYRKGRMYTGASPRPV